MELVIAWLVLAVLVGVFADSRGRSGIAWVLFSTILSPLIGFVVVLVMPDLRKAATDAADRRADRADHLAAVKSAHAPTVGVADELLRLDDLRRRGLLTDAQFEAQKSKLLA